VRPVIATVEVLRTFAVIAERPKQFGQTFETSSIANRGRIPHAYKSAGDTLVLWITAAAVDMGSYPRGKSAGLGQRQ
jgi:hypothetical protein